MTRTLFAASRVSLPRQVFQLLAILRHRTYEINRAHWRVTFPFINIGGMKPPPVEGRDVHANSGN